MTDEKKTYKAEYVCLNCGTKMLVDVEFGQSMPHFVENQPTGIMSQYTKQAPPCKYCGCLQYSHGKKPTF